MSGFTHRVFGAATLQPHVYEEVEADRAATLQALTVVLLSSIASGIGGGYATGTTLSRNALGALGGWLLWAGLTYFIGTKLFRAPNTSASWGELLRTTGFASAPGLLNLFGIIPLPFLAGLLFFVTSIWMLVAFIVAVRHALDYASTWRAVGVCLVGWALYLMLRIVII